MTTSATYAPVTAEITVPVDPATAFGLYVTRPGRQHPAHGQSGTPQAIVYEPFDGGRWYERDADGDTHDWGRVLIWQPPHRLVLAWMVGAPTGEWTFDPDPSHASRVEITFTAVDDGTRVRVLHTGFETHAGGDSIHRGVDSDLGWTDDLADLARATALVDAEPPHVHGTQTNLFCHDVDACRALFTALGLREAFRHPSEGAIEHVEVDLDGSRIGLTSIDAANRLTGLGISPDSNPASEVVLWCSDADALFARALAAGAVGLNPPTVNADGRLRFGWIETTEGHRIKLVQQLRAG
jgi:uncharacterized protein YndB with AHSA1/START domain